MYCNGPAFNATVGEKVRFYIITLGTEAGEQCLCLQAFPESQGVYALGYITSIFLNSYLTSKIIIYSYVQSSSSESSLMDVLCSSTLKVSLSQVSSCYRQFCPTADLHTPSSSTAMDSAGNSGSHPARAFSCDVELDRLCCVYLLCART